MGKIIQLIFAFLDPGQLIANLVTAAVACGGAGQAGDLMHDFKCGSILRLPPRTQLIAQMLGVPFGVLGAVPSFLLFLRTYELGGDEYPAPSAFAWKAVAEVLTGSSEDGSNAVGVPHQAVILSVLAALFAVLVRTLEFKLQYKGTAALETFGGKDRPESDGVGNRIHHSSGVFRDGFFRCILIRVVETKKQRLVREFIAVGSRRFFGGFGNRGGFRRRSYNRVHEINSHSNGVKETLYLPVVYLSLFNKSQRCTLKTFLEELTLSYYNIKCFVKV